MELSDTVPTQLDDDEDTTESASVNGATSTEQGQRAYSMDNGSNDAVMISGYPQPEAPSFTSVEEIINDSSTGNSPVQQNDSDQYHGLQHCRTASLNPLDVTFNPISAFSRKESTASNSSNLTFASSETPVASVLTRNNTLSPIPDGFAYQPEPSRFGDNASVKDNAN